MTGDPENERSARKRKLLGLPNTTRKAFRYPNEEQGTIIEPYL